MFNFTENPLAIIALSFKKLFALGMLVGGGVGAFLGEVMTNQWGVAGLAGTIGAIFSAFLLFVIRFMEQRRKNRETDTNISERIFGQQAELHSKQMANITQSLRFYQLVAAERDFIATVERRAKHDVLGQLTLAEMLISEYERELAQAKIEPADRYQRKPYAELCGDADKKVEEAKRRIRDNVPVTVAAAF